MQRTNLAKKNTKKYQFGFYLGTKIKQYVVEIQKNAQDLQKECDHLSYI